MKPLVLVLALVMISVGLSACGGAGVETMGTLQMLITDAPESGYEEVWVSFTRIEVHRDGQWEVLASFDPPKELELLSLRFSSELLGEELLPTGVYSQIRLITAETGNYVRLQNGNEYPLKVPSGPQTGLKLNHNFTLAAGQTAVIALDVNLHHLRARGATGSYNLTPQAIRVIDVVDVSDVIGWVGITDPEDPEAVKAVTDKQVSLVLLADEEVVAGTIALEQDENDHVAGDFRFAFIPAGEYTLQAFIGDSFDEAELCASIAVVVTGSEDPLDVGQIVLQTPGDA